MRLCTLFAFVASLLVDRASFAQVDHIPFRDVYVSVETNAYLTSVSALPVGFSTLSVYVSLSRNAEDPLGNVGVEVDCFEFESGIRSLKEADVELFLAACDAAASARPHRTETVSDTIRPRQSPTIFESRELAGQWIVSMTRGEQTAKFTVSEGPLLRVALAEAEAGRAWFSSLLARTPLPAPSETSHPPRGKDFHVISRLDLVSGRGLTIEVTLNRFGGEFRVEQMLTFWQDAERQGSIGLRPNLVERIAAGLSAMEADKDFSEIVESDGGTRFELTTVPAKAEVRVTVHPGDFFRGYTPKVGYFGRPHLHYLERIQEEAPTRQKWFEQNAALFFSPTGKGN